MTCITREDFVLNPAENLGQQLAESRYDPTVANRTYQGRTVSFPAYTARFRLLNVVFDVFGYVAEDVQLRADMSDDLRRALLPIWPSQFPTIWWPPVTNLDVIGGLRGLAAVPLTGVPTFVPSVAADSGTA